MSISIRCFPTPLEATADDLAGCAAVVIDVLRASTTIVTALSNGAREVIPVSSPAEVGELAARAGRGVTLMGGERDGKRIEGFDLGNSPEEYTQDRVSGRTVLFASTNGAPAIVRSRGASRVYVGGFNNFAVTLKSLQDDGLPIALVCSGRNEKFSMEDCVCAGKYVEALELRIPGEHLLNDGARAALVLYRQFRGQIADLLRSTVHGRFLCGLGFDSDMDYCARLDSVPVVAVYEEGKIRGYKTDGSPLYEGSSI